MFSFVKTRSWNCPQISFHRLIGEALLFLRNTIFLMKAMYQEGINTDLEGNFKEKN